MPDQLGRQRVTGSTRIGRDNDRHDPLALGRVGHSDHADFGDAGVLVERRLDLRRKDVEPG